MNKPILKVRNLKKYYPVRGGFFNRVRQYVRAVDDVSIDLQPGQTLGLVGESGSGKTTLGRCCLRLEEPTEGQVWFKTAELTNLGSRELLKTRSEMQMVYQDPYSSLDPKMTVLDIVAEPLIIQGFRRKDTRSRVVEILEQVGLRADDLRKYPHMFSGGQRQRIGIARALILKPSLVVLDEPTSGLDVSVQARLMLLFHRLQQSLGLSYLFISHDMRLIRYISDALAVMYRGQVLEYGPAERVLEYPKHLYTEILLRAMPTPDPERDLADLLGPSLDLPAGGIASSGCPFHPVCPYMKGRTCEKLHTPFVEVENGHWVRCHRYQADDRRDPQ